MTRSESSALHDAAAVVILAAGQGTRMKSELPKVLHEVAGRALVEHVLAAAQPLASAHTVLVLGHGRERVEERVATSFPGTTSVVQEQQLGTGHAVKVALEALPHLDSGSVLVLAGDTPLLETENLVELFAEHSNGAACTLMTAIVADPTGYGRIVRDTSGSVDFIVEHRDASDAQLAIDEINAGVYVFEIDLLREALATLGTSNAQGEQYLTDVIKSFRDQGKSVRAVVAPEVNTLGVNNRRDLANVGGILRNRIVGQWMDEGVTFEDPASVWIDRSVVLASDVTILANVHLAGATSVATGAVIGPDCSLTDTRVEEGATVLRATTLGAVIGAQATVGPYTYLRPGTVLGAKSKAGGFVEMKNADLGDGAKVPHLSYVGDATIGEGTNIGAATVFVNYDGVEKHHTTVGRHVRIGSDNMLIAPVTIGDGAYTAAGSVITDNVPAGSMAVGRARQRNILDWVLRRRPGSAAATAALAESGLTGSAQAESGLSEKTNATNTEGS